MNKLEVESKTETLTETEKASIENLLSGVSKDELPDKVKNIASESKALESLLKLHPDYKGYLSESSENEG